MIKQGGQHKLHFEEGIFLSFDIEDLDNEKKDILGEIVNIGVGNAVTALSKLIGKKVSVSVPKVKLMNFDEISRLLGEEDTQVVGILLGISGDISGYIMFVMEKKASKVLVDYLMKRQPKEDEGFSEMDLSALNELGNILAGSYLSALATMTNLKIISSTPSIAIDMAGAVLGFTAIQFGLIGDKVLYLGTELKESSTSVKGDFFLVPELDSYEKLLKALGVN